MSNRTESLHREAMLLVQQSLVVRNQGEKSTADSLLAKAFELELEAAMTLASEFDTEPARSILFRSAAALAVDCGLWKDAEKLIYFGLAGSVPEMIQKQFFTLFEKLLKQHEGQSLRLTAMKKYLVRHRDDKTTQDIRIFDQVVLLRDIPAQGFKSGDVGMVTDIFDNGETLQVEFFSLDGSSLAEIKVTASFVKPVSANMVQHVREMV